MDPVGPWSYTYNRLAAGAAAGATSGDFHHHLATAAANNAASVGAPATTSQLLAQAAHTTSLGSSATSAYPGGFLSPPTVGYDAVFTPFLHHPNPKPAHYSSTINAQHRQALAQDAAPAAAHHQPQSSAFFEQASSGGAASGSATATTWQGGGNQLPSPFGILPHENVPSSGGTGKSPAAPTNPAASVYDNFNAHIAAQSLYHINSQLAANAAVAAANKVAAAAAAVRSASPQVTASTAVPANKLTTATNFYQTPTGYAERPSYPSVISQQKQQQQQQQQPTSNSDYSTNTGGKRSGAPACQQQQQQQQQIVANAMQTSMTSAGGGHQEEQNIAKSIAEKKYNLPKGVGSGFMGSYLKFLQGERDTSPPPASRGGRKATWSRTAAAAASSTAATTTTTTTSSKSQSSYNAQQQISNGVNIHSQQIIQPPSHQQTAVDVPPDERYYQTTARNNSKRKYDDDDERTRKGVKADKGGASMDNSKDGGKKTRGVQQQVTPQQTLQTLQPTPVVQATGPPHLPLHPHPHHHHPQPPPQMMQQSYYQQPDEVPQRREMSHRKAKGRSVLQLLNMSLNNEDFAGAASDDEPAEFQDSDTDPVWTPEVDDEDEEWEQGRRKLKKTRDVRNKSRKMSQGGVEEEPQMRDFLPMKDNVQEEVVSLDMEQQMPKDTVIQMQEKSNGQKAQMPEMQGNQEGFKIGQFIVNIQDEITHEWPKLWRVDGKNLLEKYEPILKAGKIVYRNESVFAALLPESYGNYRLVKVNSLHTPTDFRNRQNSLMEWVREGTPSSPVKEQSTSHQGVIRENPAQNVTPLVDLGPEVLAATPILTPFERLMQEKLVYQEHFEIYIQTLISQALDPNFLTEIIQENDEYFLGSVRAIDSLVEGLRTRLLTARPISRNFHTALEMWPQYEVMQLGANYPPQMACTSCLRAVASVHIRFSGQLYNSVTMTARDFQTGVTYERDFTLCGQCNENLRMHHRMKHQKYTLYMACTHKVQERSGQDPTKTSTTILNELLAEDSWLEELFKNVRQSWVELELLVDPQGTTRY